MNKQAVVHDNLAFLDEIIGDRFYQYNNAFWLNSPFKSNKWNCCFGKYMNFDIDYHINLDDETPLTAPSHTHLLEIFKHWLCVQTHFDCTGGITLDPRVACANVSKTLHLIDYTLLNSKQLRLAKYGLQFINSSDIIELMHDLSSSNDISIGIYRWPDMLSNFLRNNSDKVSDVDISYFADKFPSLLDVTFDPVDRMLKLTDIELIKARTWLLLNSYYKINSSSLPYKYTPNTNKLSSQIYKNTLKGKCSKPIPIELCLVPFEKYTREFKMVPVYFDGISRMNEKSLNKYVNSLRSMGLLSNIDLPIPASALNILDSKSLLPTLNLRKCDRFLTYPQNLIFASLRYAIEFALDLGSDLVNSYLKIAKTSFEAGLSCQVYANKFGIRHLLSSKLIDLGIQSWSLYDHMNYVSHISVNISNARTDKVTYFQWLRDNKSFWELLRVLYGAIQICVGILMARRQDEISSLVAGCCLDSSGNNLLFNNCKSGTAGYRENEVRPIPQVVVKMIHMLEALQNGLIEIGMIKQHTNLFAYPKISGFGLVMLQSDQFNTSFDIFCDYTETLVIDSEYRYYIRQHPLRRFFVLLFFWGNSFGGMDTLRWFLCHSDVEHLYHYITESTPGEVLKCVKANYAAQQAICNDNETDKFAKLLELHFGTRNFSILDYDELEEYIEELMDRGAVKIEPEFFETEDGKKYRILINVIPIEDSK